MKSGVEQIDILSGKMLESALLVRGAGTPPTSPNARDTEPIVVVSR